MRKTSEKKRTTDQIDIRSALEEPVRVREGDNHKTLDPYEALFRQHVLRVIKLKCVQSMKWIIAEAERWNLIKPPPPAPTGGIFVIPKDLPEDLQREIFTHDGTEDSTEKMARIIDIVRKFKNEQRRYGK